MPALSSAARKLASGLGSACTGAAKPIAAARIVVLQMNCREQIVGLVRVGSSIAHCFILWLACDGRRAGRRAQ
jgi:hypothetical protein